MIGSLAMAPTATRKAELDRPSNDGARTIAVDVEIKAVGDSEMAVQVLESSDRSKNFVKQMFERETSLCTHVAIVRERDASGAFRAVGAHGICRDGATIVAHTRLVRLEPAHVQAMVGALLRAFEDARSIVFEGLYENPAYRRAAPRGVSWPVASDIWMKLPETRDQYESTLGHEFAKRLRYYDRRFFRDLPAARFAVTEGGALVRSQIARFAVLQHDRMRRKGRISGIDAQYEDHIYDVARTHGRIYELIDGDVLCAAALVLETRGSVFLWAIAHNRLYDKFSPGILCLALCVEENIDRHVAEFHFMWANRDADYKYRLGGHAERLRDYVFVRRWLDVAQIGLRLARTYDLTAAKARYRKLRSRLVFGRVGGLRRP